MPLCAWGAQGQVPGKEDSSGKRRSNTHNSQADAYVGVRSASASLVYIIMQLNVKLTTYEIYIAPGELSTLNLKAHWGEIRPTFLYNTWV